MREPSGFLKFALVCEKCKKSFLHADSSRKFCSNCWNKEVRRNKEGLKFYETRATRYSVKCFFLGHDWKLTFFSKDVPVPIIFRECNRCGRVEYAHVEDREVFENLIFLEATK